MELALSKRGFRESADLETALDKGVLTDGLFGPVYVGEGFFCKGSFSVV